MRTWYRVVGLIFVAASLFTTCLVALANQDQAALSQTEQSADGTLIGGFVAAGPAVNAAGQTGQSPALTVNPTSGEPWVALAQADKLVVAKWLSTTQQWAPQGDAVTSGVGSTPTLAFVGATPWVAWVEQMGAMQQLMAARFDGTGWQAAGMLNQDLNMNANQPALAVGATLSVTEVTPWATWVEASGSGQQRILVSRAISDAAAAGGYTWQPVGTALNVSAQANAAQPDITFAGSTPWVVWAERGNTGLGRIFAKRLISDSWQAVGRTAGCNSGQSCLLNNNAAQDTSQPQVAAGQLVGETSLTPWLVFTEKSATGVNEIRVLRLDPAGDSDPGNDRFRGVGGALNSQCLGNSGLKGLGGSQPDLYFVGNVPHVTWVEEQAEGAALYVCHLGDARSGQERWDLDTYYPINRTMRTMATVPSLGSNGVTPFVAWQEVGTSSNIFVAYRSPATPAWGSNRPPFIRTISWSRNLRQAVFSAAALERALQPLASTRPLTLTTSCDHVHGWEHIQEIQFKIANSQMTAFLGRYVAAEDKVYVADPTRPGVFLGGVKPGANVVPLDTIHATLQVDRMRVQLRDAASPAVDIDWIISFKDTTMLQDLRQSINILYDDGQSTGFFETGLLSFDYRVYLPAVTRQQGPTE